MDTSGDSIASIVVSLLVLAVFIRSALGMLRQAARPRTVPWLTIVLVVVIGIPSIGQYLGWPAAGDALRREPQLTLHDGQWWRVVTAILAQDGGLLAAIFSLVVVVIAVTFSSWIQGPWLTLAIFLFCSIVLNLLALGWNAVGGGTSFASDGVMLSVLAWGLVRLRDRVVVISAIIAIVGGMLLVVLDDAHGVAILLGAAIGAVHGLLGRGAASRDRSGRAARDGRGS
ncbi:MAG TPA: hypothetical protein VGM70_09435 [Pseudolysinimonas sp.]